MKLTQIIVAGVFFMCGTTASAALISVAQTDPDGVGPLVGDSNLGTAAAILAAAPAHVLDDVVTNTGMQGFDEAQGVVTSVAHGIDGGGSIAAGTAVDSHMIFLNSQGSTLLTHENVVWTFSGTILGVMSDGPGNLEAASTFELGAAGTNYTVPFGGSGPAAPYSARGLEIGGLLDAYLISGNQLTVSMAVTEPGDWIRVLTAVPVPAAVWLFGTALVGFIGFSRRRIVA